MKYSIFTFLLIFFMFSCSEKTKKETSIVDNAQSEEIPVSNTLEGNWELIGYYNYRDNKIIDSFSTNESHRQVKMYNKDKVMWSKMMPANEIEWFGYGSYSATDSTLTERMEYGSSIMNQIIAEKGEFNYKLVVEEKKYSQIQTDSAGNKMYSENYRRIN